MRHSFLVKSRPPGLRCVPHDSQSLQTRQFIKPTRPASLTDPIRTGLHRKYEDPFSVLRTAPKDNPAVWDYYGSVRKLDPQLGVIGPLRKQDHILKEGEKARTLEGQNSGIESAPPVDDEHEVWRRSLERLLVSRGGRWTITEDGTGLERTFNFKTFAKAWNFMSAIVPECKANRHHPEWSNTFRTVFIRWRTHEPDNHISLLDIKLAAMCDEQAKAFGEVIPGAETDTKPEQKTATPATSPIANTTIASAPDSTSTTATATVSNTAAPAGSTATTTTNTTTITNNIKNNGQPDVSIEVAHQPPSEPGKVAESTPNQVNQVAQKANEPTVQGTGQPIEERVPADSSGEQQHQYEQRPEKAKVEETTSTALPLEEVLKQDQKCLEETVARIRKKACTLEEVQETARKLAELAARHESGEYRFTRELSQERVNIEKEITDRLKFFRRANHEWRQAKKMEMRLQREREEQAQQLHTTSSPRDEPGEGDELKRQPPETDPEGGQQSEQQPRQRREPEARPKQEAEVLAEKKEEKPPDRIPWFHSVFRQLR